MYSRYQKSRTLVNIVQINLYYIWVISSWAYELIFSELLCLKNQPFFNPQEYQQEFRFQGGMALFGCLQDLKNKYKTNELEMIANYTAWHNQ